MPSLFLAHGAPTLAIEQHGYVDFLQGLAAALPRKPRAILLFTAHWEAAVQAVSRIEQYPMIYDFYGFPEELYRIQYPASGDPQLADEVIGLLKQAGISHAADTMRGVDHGTWTVLYHLFPQADIPVVQLSVNPLLSPDENYAIGKALSSLREQDVLIIGSGGTVHNLGRIYWGRTEPVDWAVKFEDWLAETVQNWDLDALFGYLTHAPHARDAVPRNEHFIPLLYAMGAADDDRQAKLLYSEFQFGSLSLRAWQFGSF